MWIAYSDLSEFERVEDEIAEHRGVVKAVRCSEDLASWTAPIVLSHGQQVAEYPDTTIGPDGRVYVTWTEFLGGSFVGPAERAWFAVAAPGSTHFSAPRPVIATDDLVLRGHPFGHLHANDFRLAGNFTTNTVRLVHGHPRIYMTWTHCQAEVLESVCEEAEIQLVISDDLGRTWTRPRVISAGGDNYFPSIDLDPSTGAVVVAYYTNRFDRTFHNRQDVEVLTLTPDGRVAKRREVRLENEPEADPVLQGRFIGDYLEITAAHGWAWVHFNANARSERLLGEGVPVPQQDNYLARVPVHASRGHHGPPGR